MDLVAYIRVSKVGDREGDSYQTEAQQLSAIRAIVSLTPGARLVGEPYVDRDQSGGTMDRPEVRKVIAAVEAGKVDGVVCAYLDRWARTLEALEMIERWSAEGKVFLSAREQFNPTTAQGKFALGMMLLVAKYYRDQITERWNDAARTAVERGVSTTVPYGYRRGDGNGKAHPKGGTRGAPLVRHLREAPVVERIYRERLVGHGVGMIADGLNADGLASPRGGQWNRQAVRAILKTRSYVGEARRNRKGQDPILTENAHPAIVTEADWQSVQREPRSYKRRSTRLLDSLVRCAGCGYVMGTSSAGGTRWNCTRHHAELECPSPTTCSVEALAAIVSQAFLRRYAAVSVEGAPRVNPAVDEAQAALQRASKELAAWRDDTEMRELLGDANYRAGLKARKLKLDAADEAHRTAVREAGASDLSVDPVIWSDLHLTERRELICAGVESVVISRAVKTTTPLTERIEIIWPGELDHDGSRRGVAAAVRGRPRHAGMPPGEDRG